jgi:hypothetical protein
MPGFSKTGAESSSRIGYNSDEEDMTMTSIVVQGTVTADGQLTVEQKISLPAGPVQITIQPTVERISTQKDWWQKLQEGRAILETRGAGFRSAEEIEAEREAFRVENDAC